MADRTSGVNWAVDLSGMSAWFFLLLGHSYYWMMWVFNDGWVDGKKYMRWAFDRAKWRDVANRPYFTHFAVPNLIGIAGFIVMIGNLGWQIVDRFGSPAPPASQPF